jgi:urease accessory protein
MARAVATLVFAMLLLLVEPALAQDSLDSATPHTVWHALQAGLGNPVVRIVPLAAAMAVGCLIAAQNKAALLIASYVIASVIGAAAHVGEKGLANLDAFLAVAAAAVGLMVFRTKPLRRDLAFALFAAAGLINGYALGAPIANAQRDPIVAYLIGLAVINTALALVAMYGVRMVSGRAPLHLFVVRLIGAFVIGSAVALLLQRYGGGA